MKAPPPRQAIAIAIGAVAFAVLALGAGCGQTEDSAGDLRHQRAGRRAYHGAPPTVPHALGKTQQMGRGNCLSCHEVGNARKFGVRSPVTPHPHQINCVQCHVARKTSSLFVRTNFRPLRITRAMRKSNPIGPPYIPHRLQDRSNCRSCHLSDGAARALRPRHGDRTNCTQCHVPANTGLASSKPPVFPKHRK